MQLRELRRSFVVVSVSICLFIALTNHTVQASVVENNNEKQQESFRLDCDPGEQRHFNYESSTKVWGQAANQLVRIKASLRLRCLEAPTPQTLKYLAEVLEISSDSGAGASQSKQDVRRDERRPLNKFGKLETSPRAEPVFEDVGEVLSETADKVKRSVSGWFNKTWGSVKDFFSNIFSSSERSTTSRDEVYKESGLDIAQQCRAGKTGGGGKTNVIDDSVFDDLEPKYYIGASSLDGNTAFEFTNVGKSAGRSGDNDEDEELSFFDDPKPTRSNGRLNKRSIEEQQVNREKNYEKLIKLPFVMIQARSGKMLELKFSLDDSDATVRNFKRHLCDLFATNLDRNRNQTNEISPIGKHTTNYLSSTNSSAIEQSLLEQQSPLVGSAGNKAQEEQSNNRQLVKVLALVGMQTAGAELELANEQNGAGRNPIGADTPQLSVLRSINSTSKLQPSGKGSLVGLADLDQLQVRLKQVQQINEGRMTGSAGTLGMSLVSSTGTGSSLNSRSKRSAASGEIGQELDMAELVQVSSSFAMQLVPASKLGNYVVQFENNNSKRMRRDASTLNKDNKTSPESQHKGKRETLVTKGPKDAGEREKLMEDWRQLEKRLRLAPASIQTESSNQDGLNQRLEVLRDELQLRLNEELLRNRLKRKLRSGQQQMMAAAVRVGGEGQSMTGKLHNGEDGEGETKLELLGLSLSQMLLNSGLGATQKPKRPNVYGTLEELLELEAQVSDDQHEGSMSRLIRDTARVDKLKAHCKSAMFSLDNKFRPNRRLEFREPFNVTDERDVAAELMLDDTSSASSSKVLEKVVDRNRKRLQQCKQVLQVLLRVSQPKAAELTLELMDECNERMVAAARGEELGYGPVSRYYRQLRQQFSELIGMVGRPSELLLDKLFARLHYRQDHIQDPLSSSTSTSTTTRSPFGKSANEPEFTYVRHRPLSPALETNYNKSLLMSEDDYNNSDGSGSLLMALTQLASRGSIGRTKRSELVDRLLDMASKTTCSPFHGPQLDILESLGNLQEPLEEAQVSRVVHLARKCRHQDQYLVAAVHGLQGQLSSATSQRFLADLLRSSNASCTVKSEIVLSLTSALLTQELRPQATHQAGVWPAVGTNKVDQELLEIIDGGGKQKQGRPQDRRCLGPLISYYLTKKKIATTSTSASGRRRRSRRESAAWNEDKFWDEANCRRWAVPIQGGNTDVNPANVNATLNSMGSFADEFDDNSILGNLPPLDSVTSRAAKSHQRLLERELDPVDVSSSSGNSSTSQQQVRRRHKCTASKSFGPKNAAASLRAEVVNELVGPKDENKFLARFRLGANFLGHQMDVGRMYLWHQRQTTRAHVNILGKSLWDTSHGCQDQAPKHLLYMPLFDFSLWLVKMTVGLRLHTEMGFFPSCQGRQKRATDESLGAAGAGATASDLLELYPTISLRASGEASAKFVVARAGMSLASQYGYQGSIRVSRQPDSCMSIQSGHQPMNVTFSSWLQLWDGDCHYWGPRDRHQPQATKWRLSARKPSVWLENECLRSPSVASNQTRSSHSTELAR